MAGSGPPLIELAGVQNLDEKPRAGRLGAGLALWRALALGPLT
ncbi:MAG: hypothetical protein OXU77_09865 [Gammaproteobacteria bacterium]|nr:hypothetical protein [Gammaproteobacteria bacterium]MDE0178779.1 hypothetical protein [Gammaproteobacteria bacterium]MDE0443480.1 hypothetical protein [Gammaproteobacteria bacterium]